MSTKNRSKSFLLVFNHKAGKGCSINKKNTIIDYLEKNNCTYKIINTDQLNKNNLDLYDAVVAVGGDGTVLNLIPYLANKNIKLGIIPCGTANLFAASLCIPCNIHKAIDILINGSTAKVDIGKAGNNYFALRVGIGYDAEVVNNTKRIWKKRLGYFAYFLQGIISSLKLTHKSYRITIDGKTTEINANSIIISNTGNMFKNLFSIAPGGKINDGKLDIFIMLTKNIWEFLSIIIKVLLNNKDYDDPKVIYKQAKNIKIERISENIHIDGESFDNSNIDISVIPKALSVMVP